MFSGFARSFLLLGLAALLTACIDNKTTTTTPIVAPINVLDFPFGAQLFASDGADLDVSGLALAATASGLVEQVQLSIDDGSDAGPVLLAPLLNDTTPPTSNFYWRLDSLAPESLPLGLSEIAATASFGDFTNRRSTLVARGSSWMWQADIKAYGGEWYLLDTARRALLKVDLGTGQQTVFSGFDSDTNADRGSGVELQKPVDFIIDGDRALVVDRQLAAIVAIDLVDGVRSILSDATMPNADAPLLQQPVAIALDAASGTAYVIDQARRDLIQVSLADGTRSVFAVLREADQPELVLPLDVVYQPAGTSPARPARLLVSDAKANAVIAIDIVSGASHVLVSPGDADDAVEPETFFYSQIKRLALQGDILYVTDSGLFAVVDSVSGLLVGVTGAVVQVDVSGDANDGDRTLLSAGGPDFENLFRSPQALAYDANDPLDALDDRLLVLDNQLGVIVAVEVFESEGGTPEAPISLGRRSFIPGGASLDQAKFDLGETTRALGLAADSSSVTLDLPVATVTAGLGMFVLDAAQNAVFTLNLQSGARGRIDQAQGGGDTQEQQDEALAVFDSTRFDRPALIQLDASGTAVLVVDQYDDSLVSVPLPFIDSTSVRELASSSDPAQPLDDPRAMVVYSETLAEDSTATAEELLYVLNGSGIVQIDLAAEADLASNRSAYPVGAGCVLENPAELLIRVTSDDDGVTDSAHLIVVEANAKTLHIINREDDVCTSVDYSYDGAGIVAADVEIVDVLIADEDSDAMLTTLLLLDSGNRAVFSLALDVAAATATTSVSAVVLSSSAQPLDGANTLVSPLGIGYDASAKSVYVLDDVLRSVYVIDVAERHVSSGRRLTQCDIDHADTTPIPTECKSVNSVPSSERTITGQRLVISRGTSLNCQPVADCEL